MTEMHRDDELDQWSSQYLLRGFGQDVITIRELTSDYNGLSARFTVKCGEDGPKPFHLSTISAHRVVAQLGINFICHQLKNTKNLIGEVWELSYSGSYKKPILHDAGISISLTLLSRTQRKQVESWLFRFDVGNGAFKGTISLAPERVPFATNGEILQTTRPLRTYQDFYYSFYGNQMQAAQVSKSVYCPKACLGFKATKALATEIRELAATMANCLQKIFDSYNSGNMLGFDHSISNRLLASKRSKFPSLIRLDVIETRDGLKIVEVNAGNCGGAETYFRMQQFLREEYFPNARERPFLLDCFLDEIGQRPGRAVFTYLEDQSQYLSLARKQIYQQLAPNLLIDVLPLSKLLSDLRSGAVVDFIYRDFVYEELASAGDIGREAEKLFISDIHCPPYFPSFSDEILSDKAYIAEVDHRVRRGLGSQVGLTESDCRNWQRWLAPCTTSNRILLHDGELDFDMPDGVVIKPADGYGGDRVFIFPVCALPMNRSFYGQTQWVVQRFFDSPTYSVTRGDSTFGEDKVHLVHGVFVMPHDGTLQYAGTFTRLSPDLVVNIKNDGDVVLFCEPEWFE
jgi:hypothetical protein